MSDTDQKMQGYVSAIMRMQRSLYAFILVQVPSVAEAEDVLQETNLVLWAKREEFVTADNCRALVFQVARYQVLAHHKKRRWSARGFDEALIEQLAAEAEERADGLDDKRRAMGNCIEKLRPRDRRMIADRYSRNLSGRELAERMGRTADSVFHSLHRIRATLLECVRRTLATEDHA